VSTEEFDDAFRDRLRALGYDVVSTSMICSMPKGMRAEYLIGGTINVPYVDAAIPSRAG
jgi:hypothetical protein